MFALRIPKGVNKTATAFCHYRPSFLPKRPTSEERLFPVRARLLRVTQKVSSYSIHTLLCSDEHKIRLRADCGRTDFNRSIKPSDSSCRLDAKPRLPRRLFKKQKRQTSPFRQHYCHFRQKLYNRYFLTVETNVRPSGWTAEGRQEQTDK